MFYAIDRSKAAARGEGIPDILAFHSKAARDNFVGAHHYRDVLTLASANNLVRLYYFADDAKDALKRGLI